MYNKYHVAIKNNDVDLHLLMGKIIQDTLSNKKQIFTLQEVL